MIDPARMPYIAMLDQMKHIDGLNEWQRVDPMSGVIVTYPDPVRLRATTLLQALGLDASSGCVNQTGPFMANLTAAINAAMLLKDCQVPTCVKAAKIGWTIDTLRVSEDGSRVAVKVKHEVDFVASFATILEDGTFVKNL